MAADRFPVCYKGPIREEKIEIACAIFNFGNALEYQSEEWEKVLFGV